MSGLVTTATPAVAGCRQRTRKNISQEATSQEDFVFAQKVMRQEDPIVFLLLTSCEYVQASSLRRRQQVQVAGNEQRPEARRRLLPRQQDVERARQRQQHARDRAGVRRPQDRIHDQHEQDVAGANTPPRLAAPDEQSDRSPARSARSAGRAGARSRRRNPRLRSRPRHDGSSPPSPCPASSIDRCRRRWER